MEYVDDDSPFADLPRYPAGPEEEPTDWLDTALENFAHAGPKLALWGLFVALCGTAVSSMAVFGLVGIIAAILFMALAFAVVVLGHSAWRR